MNKVDFKTDELIKTIEETANKLEEIEVIYKESKEKFNNKIQSDLKQLSLLSDGQEMLIKIVNNLYWNTNIAAKYIQSVCVSESGEVKNLIRNLTLEFPCRENCGSIVKERFTSRSSLADFTRNKRSEYSQCRANAS